MENTLTPSSQGSIPTETKNSVETVKVGVIVGAGTGFRLANIFKKFLSALVEQYAHKRIVFAEDLVGKDRPYIYHSYKSLFDFAGNDTALFDAESRKEVDRLLNLTRKWYSEGVRVIFRTSINAEALYRFRQEVKAIKVFGLETPTGSRILFVRDQAEGFYANTSYNIDEEDASVSFSGVYTKQHQQDVARFALKEAEQFMQGQPYQKWAVYKFHLFANLMEKWVKEIDPDFQAYQPDNGLTNLFELISRGHYLTKKINVVCICSNEVGDMVYEAILGAINIEPKLELYTRNIYIGDYFSGGLTEYQTVHGSADDLPPDSPKLMPYATIRIAADIVENYFNVPRVKAHVEVAISEMKRAQVVESDKILQFISRSFNLTTSL